MKKTLSLCIMLMAMIMNIMAESAISFEKTSHNFGTFSEANATQKCTFTFTNTGDKPLTISQAHASCGCTVPQFSKAPIPPGGKGKIYVTYNGKGRAGGQFRKVITVVSSASNSLARIYVEGTIEIED